MKANMTKHKGQVYSVGNYLMTGKVLGKGHFARVEEATHRVVNKKVAIKIIDLTCIKEEYARRNLHREPRVMAKLRHPCIAALYETMMHGPRLYVVMEACGGGDLCAHVLAAGAGRPAGARGLPEARAKALAAQLVSAVRHMHSRGVVHRDLKMENIMLDSTKQFIKIVDFGLSNVWNAGGALKTPCGSLEYAAPELFVDGRRYGPEVDLWSIGVIVYGMVTGGLPFTGEGGEKGEGREGRSRPLLRAAIARGFGRKQRAALAYVSAECKAFIQQLLEPNVDLRMKIDEAARHRWVKKSGMRMKIHPLGCIDPRFNREIYRQISELSGQPIMDIVAQIKAEPFGAIAGMYNIKTHLHQLNTSGTDLLWSSNTQEVRPQSPPEYKTLFDIGRPGSTHNKSISLPKSSYSIIQKTKQDPINRMLDLSPNSPTNRQLNGIINRCAIQNSKCLTNHPPVAKEAQPQKVYLNQMKENTRDIEGTKTLKSQTSQNPRFVPGNRPVSIYGVKKPVYRIYDNGDCGLDPRLPRINEHSNTDLNEAKKNSKIKIGKPCIRRTNLEDPIRLNSCPNRVCDVKRNEFYRRAGDGLPSWRTGGTLAPTRIFLQNNATTIKRASLGNIISPHSSSNSHCKSERALPVGWFSSRNPVVKENTHLQRLRRTAPIK